MKIKQAVGQNLVVERVEQPEDAKIKYPDGKHPTALRVLSVGEFVRSERIKEGVIVAAAGDLTTVEGFDRDKFIINEAQIKVTIEE